MVHSSEHGKLFTEAGSARGSSCATKVMSSVARRAGTQSLPELDTILAIFCAVQTGPQVFLATGCGDQYSVLGRRVLSNVLGAVSSRSREPSGTDRTHLLREMLHGQPDDLT